MIASAQWVMVSIIQCLQVFRRRLTSLYITTANYEFQCHYMGMLEFYLLFYAVIRFSSYAISYD